MRRATLEIRDEPGPGGHTLVSAIVDFDRRTGKWRASDESGNAVLHERAEVALLRVLERRLTGAVDETTRLHASLIEALALVPAKGADSELLLKLHAIKDRHGIR